VEPNVPWLDRDRTLGSSNRWGWKADFLVLGILFNAIILSGLTIAGSPPKSAYVLCVICVPIDIVVNPFLSVSGYDDIPCKVAPLYLCRVMMTFRVR
jgi:hypothetical protein